MFSTGAANTTETEDFQSNLTSVLTHPTPHVSFLLTVRELASFRSLVRALLPSSHVLADDVLVVCRLLDRHSTQFFVRGHNEVRPVDQEIVVLLS